MNSPTEFEKPSHENYILKIKQLQNQGIIFNIRPHDGCILWHSLNYDSIKTIEAVNMLMEVLNNDRNHIKTSISRSEIHYPNDEYQKNSRFGMDRILRSMNFAYDRLGRKFGALKKENNTNKEQNVLEIFRLIVKRNVDPELYNIWMDEAAKQLGTWTTSK